MFKIVGLLLAKYLVSKNLMQLPSCKIENNNQAYVTFVVTVIWLFITGVFDTFYLILHKSTMLNNSWKTIRLQTY